MGQIRGRHVVVDGRRFVCYRSFLNDAFSAKLLPAYRAGCGPGGAAVLGGCTFGFSDWSQAVQAAMTLTSLYDRTGTLGVVFGCTPLWLRLDNVGIWLELASGIGFAATRGPRTADVKRVSVGALLLRKRIRCLGVELQATTTVVTMTPPHPNPLPPGGEGKRPARWSVRGYVISRPRGRGETAGALVCAGL